MSLSSTHLVTSADITALKNKVKTEMAKRAYGAGPLDAFSSDFTIGVTSANQGQLIKIEHFDETVGYIEKINDTGIIGTQGGLLNAIALAETQLDNYMTRDRYDTVSDCRANCTGYCSDVCIGGCRDTCTANCSSDCEGSCTAQCADDCNWSCWGQCRNDCSGGCSTNCGGDGCTNLCTSCYTSCSGGCKGCDWTCDGSCRTGCWNEHWQ